MKRKNSVFLGWEFVVNLPDIKPEANISHKYIQKISFGTPPCRWTVMYLKAFWARGLPPSALGGPALWAFLDRYGSVHGHLTTRRRMGDLDWIVDGYRQGWLLGGKCYVYWVNKLLPTETPLFRGMGPPAWAVKSIDRSSRIGVPLPGLVREGPI